MISHAKADVSRTAEDSRAGLSEFLTIFCSSSHGHATMMLRGPTLPALR
jgi:hypothetical protein